VRREGAVVRRAAGETDGRTDGRTLLLVALGRSAEAPAPTALPPVAVLHGRLRRPHVVVGQRRVVLVVQHSRVVLVQHTHLLVVAAQGGRIKKCAREL
jgi:hypothetical protein